MRNTARNIGLFFVVFLVATLLSVVIIERELTRTRREEQRVATTFGRRVARVFSNRIATLQRLGMTLRGVIHGENATIAPGSEGVSTPVGNSSLEFVFKFFNETVQLHSVVVAPNDTIATAYPVPVTFTYPSTPGNLAVRESTSLRIHLHTPAASNGRLMIAVAVPIFADPMCTPQPACLPAQYWGRCSFSTPAENLVGSFDDFGLQMGHSFRLYARERGVPSAAEWRIVNWTCPTGNVMAGEEGGEHARFEVPHFGSSRNERYDWFVVVRRHGGFTNVGEAGWYVAAIFGSFAGGLVVVLLVVLVEFCLAWANSGGTRFPTRAPLAVITTEIDEGPVVWSEVPAAASETVAKVEEIARSEAAKDGAFVVELLGDGHLLVAKSATAALACAERIRKQVSAVEWPAVARVSCPTLPQHVRLRVAVHWCKDAAVKGLDEPVPEYTGGDIDLALAMRNICPCDRVALTPQLRHAALFEGADSKAFLPLGMSIANPDSLSFPAYVVKQASDNPPPNDGGRPAVVLDAGDAANWDTMAEIEDNSCSQRFIDSAENFNDGSGELPQRHDPVRGSPGLRATSRALAASKLAVIEATLSQPAFAAGEHATWLPARTCEVADMQRLHQILQDHITTPEEAVHYSALLTLSTYCFQAFTFMLEPLESVERTNIARKLQRSFGIPERGFALRLAVQTSIVAFRALRRMEQGNSGNGMASRNTSLAGSGGRFASIGFGRGSAADNPQLASGSNMLSGHSGLGGAARLRAGQPGMSPVLGSVDVGLSRHQQPQQQPQHAGDGPVEQHVQSAPLQMPM